ncbi:MAG: hypothetical protein AMXMBFR12_06930 [Candidatus Babeliales bacterium]
MKKIFLLLCLFSSLHAQIETCGEDEIYDEYVRKNFAERKITEMSDIPAHLKRVIEKASVDSNKLHIYVSEEFTIHTTFSNFTIGLPAYFFDFSPEEQAVHLAHELSHIKHKDASVKTYGNLERNLADFQLGSTLLLSIFIGTRAYQSNLSIRNLANTIITGAAINIAALYYYFAQKRICESRADREAVQLVGTQAYIAQTKKWILAKKHDAYSLMDRITYYLEYCGFSDHPSDEQRLSMLLKIQAEEKQK